MPRHGRRQTYFETPGPHRDATPCFFQELALCLPANAGADASERGSRRKRIWGQRRTCLGADASASARRQHCSSLCSQSEGHEHVANMTNALGDDFVVFSARAWPPQYSPPHFARKVSYSASPQGFVAPYYLAKTQVFFEKLNTLPFRGAVASLPILIFWIMNILPRKSNFGPRKSGLSPQKSLTLHNQKNPHNPMSDYGDF